MYQHNAIHRAVANALSKTPRAIVSDVDLDPDTGFIRITDRAGNERGYRYYTADEITERGGEGWAAEGTAYRHVYFFSADVPAEVRDVLSA